MRSCARRSPSAPTTASRRRGNSPTRCALQARSGRRPRAERRCPRRRIRTRRCPMSRLRAHRRDSTPPTRHSPTTAIAIVAALAVAGAGAMAAAWWRYAHARSRIAIRQRRHPASQAADAPPRPRRRRRGAAPHDLAGGHAAALRHGATAAPDGGAAPVPSGSLLISAVGLVDPSDPRYASDKALLQADVRADSKSQLVEKALVLLLDRNSFASNYDLLQSRLLSKADRFIDTIVRESEPQIGKDGLMSVTTQAVVNVKAVQQSLNQMSRDERVQLIRASGDPRVSLRISVRDADQPDAPAQPSPIAENILKERIQLVRLSHVVRRRDAPATRRADFAVTGEANAEEAVDAARSVGPRHHQVRAVVVDGQMHRPRDRRGNLLQHDAAEGRRQLGERGRGAAGDRHEGRRPVLARVLPAARPSDGPQGHARRGQRHARCRRRGAARARAARPAGGDQRDAARARRAARLRPADRRAGRRQRRARGRRHRAAQRQARRRRASRSAPSTAHRCRRVRSPVRRRARACTAGNESARQRSTARRPRAGRR